MVLFVSFGFSVASVLIFMVGVSVVSRFSITGGVFVSCPLATGSTGVVGMGFGVLQVLADC